MMTGQSPPADLMIGRNAERRRLIDERLAIDARERRRRSLEIGARLHQLVGERGDRTVSGYWPFKGEPDLRPWMQIITEGGGRCALPVVAAKSAPLVFRVWQQGDRLERGVWNIPVPADGAEVVPDIVVAPLIGFDKDCYRLGYGGGYYDRTLAALSSRPLIIGVGYARATMISIRPQPHDIPMDVIVTEERIIYRSAPGHLTRSPERCER